MRLSLRHDLAQAAHGPRQPGLHRPPRDAKHLGHLRLAQLGDRLVQRHALAQAALGTPDHVYYDTATHAVALAWTDRPGLPADPESGLGVVVTQFRADMGPQTFEKLLLEGAVIEQVVVGQTTGYWLEGGPHLFYFRSADGSVADTTIRLVGTTLMWERDGKTVRIEGAPDLETAKRIAESMEGR